MSTDQPFPPVYTQAIACRDCYKCVRACSVKAIKVNSGIAEIIADACLFCGKCYEVCPGSAKKVRNDLDQVKMALKSRKTIVSLAPSYASEFSGVSKEALIAAIKQLGFYGVSETALGAEYLNDHILQKIETMSGIIISSACPSTVLAVQKYFPELALRLLELDSPMVAHAKMIKHRYGENTNVVFVGPCIAKKHEGDCHQDVIAGVLGFKELKEWMLDSGVILAETSATEGDLFIPHSASNGVIYPQDGGMIKSMRLLEDVGYQGVHFSGLETIKGVLEELSELKHQKLFVELLACSGGCVNGPLVESKGKVLTSTLQVQELRNQNKSRPFSDVDIDITTKFSATAVLEKRYPLAEQESVLQKIGKFSSVDELNCGGCGYDSCRLFSQACLVGKAETAMCVSYMRKQAQKKSNALIKSIPSGVLIVDKELKILDSNVRCIELLGGDLVSIYESIGTIEKVSLKKKISFYHLFRSVLESDEEIINKDIQYNKSILSVSIFPIEPRNIVGAIIQDVTNPVVQRDRIVKKAKEVIENNNKTVQQIAYLLGENAAESEIMLSSIIDSYSLNR